MRKAFVAGWPISHSKSPELHGFWLKQHKLEGSYEPLAIESDAFPKFLDDLSNSGFVGGNITIPHKEIAFSSLLHRDAAAEAIGAVNTVWLENGIVNASNTDAYGFSANLDDLVPEWRNKKIALVLGAGGASRAIVFALLEAGYKQINIVNRTYERAQNLADRFGDKVSAHRLETLSELLMETELFINTTSLGMSGSGDDVIPDLSNLPSTAIVTDIVYTPLETPILKHANELGLKTADGLGMLLHQAVPGFEKWFGIRPEVTAELRAHILEPT